MSTETIIREQVLVTTTCANCGMLFAVPEHWDESKRKKHDGFYCPNGHSLIYNGKTQVEKERDQTQANLERYKKWLAEEEQARKAEQRQHAATKGKLTKARNRAKNGVCPCCHRTFKQLARHMESQHPGFDPAAA